MAFLDMLLGRPARDAREAPDAGDARVAAAALLVEAAQADGGQGAVEHAQILELLASRLELGPWAARELLERASLAAAQGSDWHGFTRVINDAYDQDGRVALVQMLWEVVLADGAVHDYEAALMRRVPALLRVTDRESSAARARARARLDGRGRAPAGRLPCNRHTVALAQPGGPMGRQGREIG